MYVDFFISQLQDLPKIIPSRFSVLLFVCHLSHTASVYFLLTATLFACRFFSGSGHNKYTLFNFVSFSARKLTLKPSPIQVGTSPENNNNLTKTLKICCLVGVAFGAHY